MCFGKRSVVLCKSHDVKIVHDAGGVYNTGGNEQGGVRGKKGYVYSSSGDFLVQHVRYDTFDSYPVLCWLTNTKQPCLLLAQPPGTSSMTSLKTRLITCSVDSLQPRVLLLDDIPLLPLRPRASQSK